MKDPLSKTSAVPRVATLRRRALDAAREMLEESGAEELHLRALANAIGCGVASLYYHFADKDALLAAVAIEGFQDLKTAIVETTNSGQFERRAEAASIAYLEFMQNHLRLYALMHAENTLTQNAAVRDAEQDAFEAFRSALAGDLMIPERQIEDVALMFWALGRGIASTILSRGVTDPDAAIEHARKIIRGYRHVRSLPPIRN